MSSSVTITFGTDTRNMALARTVAATMAARVGLTVDRLEDVRLAVDEAVSQVLLDAPADSEVTCVFTVADDALLIRVTAPTASGSNPSPHTFGWTVLQALVDAVEPDVADGLLTLHLRIDRPAPVGA